jgi:hypothetical protein
MPIREVAKRAVLGMARVVVVGEGRGVRGESFRFMEIGHEIS